MTKSDIKTEVFHPSIISQFWIIPVIILCLGGVIRFGESILSLTSIEELISKWPIVLWEINFISGLCFFIILLFFPYIVITSYRIEYHDLGYSIYAEWGNVIQIQKYWEGICFWKYPVEELVIQNPEIKANRLFILVLRLAKAENKIPIQRFGNNWRRTELGKIILRNIMVA